MSIAGRTHELGGLHANVAKAKKAGKDGLGLLARQLVVREPEGCERPAAGE